jgi:SAM-dependent methyltransferase
MKDKIPTTIYQGAENLDAMVYAKRYNNKIFSWIQHKINRNNKILEFGAGKGEFANRFESHSIDVIEIDTNFFTFLNQNTYENLKQLSKKYDLIYSINVLEHIENDLDTLIELKDKLKIGGKLKIFVPARMELFGEMDKKVGHYRRYHRRNLEKLVEQAGFQIESCRYFDFAGYFISLIYKWLKMKGSITPQSVKFYDKLIFPVSMFFDWLTFGQIIGKNLIINAKRNT